MDVFPWTGELKLIFFCAYHARYFGGLPALRFVEFLVPFIFYGSISRTDRKGIYLQSLLSVKSYNTLIKEPDFDECKQDHAMQ